MKEWDEANIKVDMCTIGGKASGFFRRLGGNIIAQSEHLGDSPSLEDLIGAVKVMLDGFDNGKIDQLFVVYNHFVNTMTQKSIVRQLLPISSDIEDKKLQHHWDYIYEPESKEVLDALLTRYIESLVYQSVVENVACEQAARMVAMKSASDNATDLIDELQLAYNKARQAAITQELSEIVAGAAAI
jgi:F-type H+-transporting ATPase subunit gamma